MNIPERVLKIVKESISRKDFIFGTAHQNLEKLKADMEFAIARYEEEKKLLEDREAQDKEVMDWLRNNQP